MLMERLQRTLKKLQQNGVLERLLRTTNQHVAELTPRNWKKAQAPVLKKAA